MKVIGLTGGTGSGKSVVARTLLEKGAYIIDADEIAHDIIKKGKPAYNEILVHFGNGILDDNNNIIRRRLGDIVFSKPAELEFLNKCTHKYISQEIQWKIEEIQKRPGYSCIVIDAPLLIEANLLSQCNEVWVVYAEEQTRIDRIMDRDHLTAEQAANRIKNQKTWQEYRRFADKVIDNSRDLAYVQEQMEKIWTFERNDSIVKREQSGETALDTGYE